MEQANFDGLVSVSDVIILTNVLLEVSGTACYEEESWSAEKWMDGWMRVE